MDRAASPSPYFFCIKRDAVLLGIYDVSSDSESEHVVWTGLHDISFESGSFISERGTERMAIHLLVFFLGEVEIFLSPLET